MLKVPFLPRRGGKIRRNIMKICPKCKCENPDTANFCRNCRENLQFLTPDLDMNVPANGQNDRFGGWGGDFDRTGTVGVPDDFSRTTAADSWGDDPGQTRSNDDWNIDPDRTGSFDSWGETAAEPAPLRENPAAGREQIDRGKGSSGDDFQKMAQGLFADDFSDSQASGEAKRRQKRADAQQKEREKRRRQEDDRKKQERKKKKEKAPSDPWGSEAETGSDDSGNDNGEWIDNRGDDKPVKKDSSGNVIKIIAGLAVVAILAVAIVLVFKKINRPPTPASPVAESGDSGSQDSGGENGQEEGAGSSVSQPASTDGNSGSDGESQPSEEDAIGFSEEDFNSGMYSTVVTLKSQYLDEVPLYNNPGEFSVDTIPEAAACALVTQKSVDGITWDFVDYCGKTGWVMDQYIRHVGDDVQYFYPGNDFGNTVYVYHLKTIKLHSKPNSDPATVCAEGIPYGTDFEIDSLDRGWGHTYYNGQECWIDMKVVRSYASLTWQIEQGNGESPGIKLRQGPSEGTRELIKIPLRTVVNEIEHKNGWVRVNYGGYNGWVKLHYASPCGSGGLPFSEG